MIVITKQVLTDLAKQVRKGLAENGHAIGHARCLEAVSAALGFRDLNAATALLEQRPILVGVPATPTRATDTLIDTAGNPLWRRVVHINRILDGVEQDERGAEGPQPAAIRDVCLALPMIGVSAELWAEAQQLQMWLSRHEVPDTRWAGMDTLELAEQVSSAGERLQQVQNLRTELGHWQAGTIYRPDVALDVVAMRDRLSERLAQRAQVQVDFRDAREVWAKAFVDVAMNGSQANPKLANDKPWLSADVQARTLHATENNAAVWTPDGRTRWSMVDVSIHALAAALARDMAPGPMVGLQPNPLRDAIRGVTGAMDPGGDDEVQALGLENRVEHMQEARQALAQGETSAMLRDQGLQDLPDRVEGIRTVRDAIAQGEAAALLQQHDAVVPASILIDGDSKAVHFDAVPFLRDADPGQLNALQACGWRGDYAADDVAWHVRQMPGYEAVDHLMTRMEAEEAGFEVEVNPAAARNWLGMFRPEVLAGLPDEADEELPSSPAPR